MQAESVPYIIEVEGNKNAIPDLSHLEKELRAIKLPGCSDSENGFFCEPQLKELQTENSKISRIKTYHYHLRSYIIKEEKGFRMVVSPEDKKLHEFAKNYNPVPLQR